MKKAQVSIEYVTTYSWALVVVAVIIGTLIYYGAFDADKEVENNCDLGPQLLCEEFNIDQEGIISIKLRNGINDAIILNKIKIDGEESNCQVSKASVNSGEELLIYCAANRELFSGDNEEFGVEIFFNTMNANSEFSSKGTISTQVTAEKTAFPAEICDFDGDSITNNFCGGNDCNDNSAAIKGPTCFSDAQCVSSAGEGSTCIHKGTCKSYCTSGVNPRGCPPNCVIGG